MLEAGDRAPDFTLADQSAEPVTLSALRGGPVVLYFYPRADTPGCTTQACGVRDRRAGYEAAGARVIGVSPDTVEAIAEFARKHSLDFTLLAEDARRRRPRGPRGAWLTGACGEPGVTASPGAERPGVTARARALGRSAEVGGARGSRQATAT